LLLRPKQIVVQQGLSVTRRWRRVQIYPFLFRHRWHGHQFSS